SDVPQGRFGEGHIRSPVTPFDGRAFGSVHSSVSGHWSGSASEEALSLEQRRHRSRLLRALPPGPQPLRWSRSARLCVDTVDIATDEPTSHSSVKREAVGPIRHIGLCPKMPGRPTTPDSYATHSCPPRENSESSGPADRGMCRNLQGACTTLSRAALACT